MEFFEIIRRKKKKKTDTIPLSRFVPTDGKEVMLRHDPRESSIPRRRSIHPLDSSRSNLFRPRRLATRSYPSRRVHFSRSTMNKGDDARRRRDAPTPLRRIPSIHPTTRSRKCLDKGVENVTREINNFEGEGIIKFKFNSFRAELLILLDSLSLSLDENHFLILFRGGVLPVKG